jgi:sulfite oxidase
MWYGQMVEFNIDRRGFLICSATASWGAIVGFGGAGWNDHAFAAMVDGASLIVHSESPLNAEPAPADLMRDWITPNKYFYVRNHGTIPTLDAATFHVRVSGLVENELALTVEELHERFPAASTVATMICAGCRRSELSAVKPIAGVQWGVGPIGNAEWSGVWLGDVLKRAGIKADAKHVWFESVDKVEKNGRTFAFGASVPLSKALPAEKSHLGVLLATEMNGKALEPSHGFPLRAVVPGYIGARSVKWLGQIVVSNRPNPNYFMSTAYRLAEETGEAQRMANPIYEFPINAAICTTKSVEEGGAKRLLVQGFALPPGMAGRTIARVDISADGGKTWQNAKFREPAREYCWQLWSADVPVRAGTKELIARAIDSSGAVQPEKAQWNVGGYLCNSWYRAPIE